MARKAKAAVGPNSTAKKAAARKAHKCQLCDTKVMPAKAKSVVMDPPGDGEVSIVKAREGKSYWCAPCAKKKAKMYEAAVARKRANESSPKKSKATKAKATKTKAKGRKRSTAKKAQTPAQARRERTRKSVNGEPF